eukprot:TRINITY_DN2624_c0_g1_i4.p1 TRINITY_DN2624_c0_g1~~TRINITY_DN2624_c0_g1_i4.p1  ORF type:complete len:286 (-),score=75.28 TRINITY_DN2624_c0_g1_i4:1419-2165(-)
MSGNDSVDVQLLQAALKSKPPKTNQGGIRPYTEMLENLAEEFPELSFSQLLAVAEKRCVLDNLYFMCDLRQVKKVATVIDHVHLSIQERITFCDSPVRDNDPIPFQFLLDYAECVSRGEDVKLEIYSSDFGVVSSPAALEKLEMFHSVHDLYLTLGRQFEGVFVDMERAESQRLELCDAITASILSMGKQQEADSAPGVGLGEVFAAVRKSASQELFARKEKVEKKVADDALRDITFQDAGKRFRKSS